jgi:nucleoside 2-deoxyribosyltransferase
MQKCFVIQPFDGGVFDRRYEETVKPAIEAADYEPYRVDRDPKVYVIIDSIEKEIRESAACLADISLDNPNVWYELGYAVACNKPIVMICCDTRTDIFPFDIQHRHVIRYGTHSESDFSKLRRDITDKLAAARDESLLSLASMSDPVAQASGLSQVEIAVLVD